MRTPSERVLKVKVLQSIEAFGAASEAYSRSASIARCGVSVASRDKHLDVARSCNIGFYYRLHRHPIDEWLNGIQK